MSAKAKAAMLAMGLMALAGLSSMPAPAAPPTSPVRVAQATGRVAAGREVSREQAVALVQQRFNARVLRVNVVDEGGHRTYVVQILSDGTKVSFVRVDASTGAISRD
jgi:uncharacterized membrane protein YkoI